LLLFDVPPPTHIYTLSLHDALPIYLLLPGAGVPAAAGGLADFRRARPDLPGRAGCGRGQHLFPRRLVPADPVPAPAGLLPGTPRSEEHTSELQSRENLVCRLLLEKK